MDNAASPIFLAEYLSTEYEPDCEYVDGLLEDRNVGQQKHSETQGLLIGWLRASKPRHGLQVRTLRLHRLAMASCGATFWVWNSTSLTFCLKNKS